MRVPERTVSWRLMVGFLAAHSVWAVLVNLGFRARLPYLGTLSANLLGILVAVVWWWYRRSRRALGPAGAQARRAFSS